MGEQKRHADSRVIPLLCWLKQVRHFQYALCLHENVKGFDTKLLTETLGDLYTLETLEMQPSDLGWGRVVSRPRLFTILVNNQKALLTTSVSGVFEEVKKRFRRFGPMVTAGDCLVALPAELLAEENRMRVMRGLQPVEDVSANWSYLSFGFILQFSCPWTWPFGFRVWGELVQEFRV